VTPASARAIGLVVLMIGVGLRLDSSWQTLAAGTLGAGGILGLWGLLAGAFVRPTER